MAIRRPTPSASRNCGKSPPANHKPGLIEHTVGWPLDTGTYGGSFLYHFGNNLISYGFVIGLDYRNPWLSPFDEMQRFKTHPEVRKHFEGGRRISYGARALNEGGLQSIPRLTFPGGALIGDAAGFVNVPKIKGTHTSMKSGMLAAETVAEALAAGGRQDLATYQTKLRDSWVWQELSLVSNIRPSFAKFGMWGGLAYSALDTYLLRGKAPWTFHHSHPDNETLLEAEIRTTHRLPAPGWRADIRSAVLGISQQHQPRGKPAGPPEAGDPDVAISLNWRRFRSPEIRYCPAGVYEIVGAEEGQPRLQINAQNCVHCKTCDIKDPSQNINWVTPEGGGGPNYPGGM